MTCSYGRIDFILFFSFVRRLIKTTGIYVIFNHTINGSELFLSVNGVRLLCLFCKDRQALDIMLCYYSWHERCVILFILFKYRR